MGLRGRELFTAVVLLTMAVEANVELPDVIEDAEAVSQMQPPTALVTLPPKILPSIPEIQAMPDANRNGRKHFYVSALVLAYLGVVIVGTCILWLGTKCKNRGAREPQHILTGMDDAAEAAPELPPAKAGLSRRCVNCTKHCVMKVFGKVIGWS